MPRHRASSDGADTDRVGVLLPLPLGGTYDYRRPAEMPLEAGDFVDVPLGTRQVTGVVWGAGSGDIDGTRLKDVAARLEAPPLPDVSRRLVEWVAAYTISPPGAVLKMAMSVPAALAPPKPVLAYGEAPVPDGLRLTAARRRVLAAIAGEPPRIAVELARAAGVGVSVVRGLADAGALRRVHLTPVVAVPDWRRAGPTLSPAQAAAATALRVRAGDGTFSVSVLEGVPGSGKTEVYFEALAEALERGRQGLVLVPEIALTAQWLERFHTRFGAAPVLWHSDLTQGQRRSAWRAVADASARVVVGARSALFLPFPDLGLIVVDEEHDAAYKQEDGVVYNARDMAVVRGRLGDHAVVLASATPSLETQVNVDDGRYDAFHLPDRHGGAGMPEIGLVDMRGEGLAAGAWLSPTLADAVAATLDRGQQALLFLNRRGYAPLTLCRACGHRLQCPNCDAWLVEHRAQGRLQCHHCGRTEAPAAACPQCAEAGRFAACGPGVERLAEEVEGRFPGVRLTVAASDTIAGPRAAEDLVRTIEAHDVDVVIGTQIVAKGHHFPLLTLVGVVDADLGLTGGDLRAAERTFQLLYQVAGRAGRAGHPGRVLVQTYMPESPVMQALSGGTRDAFVAAEVAARRTAGMPPFARLVGVVVAAADAAAADAQARALGRTAPRIDGVQVLGPAPAPLALLRGRHRRRLLLKARRDIAVQPVVRAWLAAAGVAKGVRVHVDVDPYSFL